ncbi:MAG: hypothetical protein ACI9Y7_001782 [Dokdonia sp.]|jgi:hypothetical protein
MFDKTTIKQSPNLYDDLGNIAESALFYKEVNFVCNPSFFKYLIDHKEVDAILELMDTGRIKILLENNMIATSHKTNLPNNFCYNPVIWSSGDVSDRLERVIYETTQRSGYSRRLSKKIIDKSERVLYPIDVINYVKQDLKDQVYLKRIVSSVIQDFDPAISIAPEEINIKVNKLKDGYTITTNLDLERISNKFINKHPINAQSILYKILNARIDSTLVSGLKSDLVTSPIITSMINLKVNDVINRSADSLKQIDSFSDVYLHDGKKVSNVISSGERSLLDFIKVLEKGEKFQDWVFDINDGENLLREYNNAISKDTWIDKLPGKSFRWSIFTGTGLVLDLLGTGAVGTVIGFGISAADQFLLDKIIKGWKPNSFVNGDLNNFLKNK